MDQKVVEVSSLSLSFSLFLSLSISFSDSWERVRCKHDDPKRGKLLIMKLGKYQQKQAQKPEAQKHKPKHSPGCGKTSRTLPWSLVRAQKRRWPVLLMQLRSWVSPKEAPVLCMVCVLSSANKDPIIRHSCFIAHCPEPLAERTSVIAALKYRDVKTWQYQRVSASNSLGKSVERSDCQGEPKQEACIDLGYRSLPLISETRRQRSLSSPADMGQYL